jgi:hypothetical protein
MNQHAFDSDVSSRAMPIRPEDRAAWRLDHGLLASDRQGSLGQRADHLFGIESPGLAFAE